MSCITVSGVVLGTDHNLHSQVPWIMFESAKINVLLEHINSVAMKLQPYAVDLAAQPSN